MRRAAWELAVCLLAAGALSAQTAADIGKALAHGQAEQAVELADRLLTQHPEDARLWTLRGAALAQQGQAKAALASFEKALAISPDFLPALQGAAQVTYAEGSPEAEQYLRRIVSNLPSDATAHAMLGGLAAEARRCPEAIEEFDKAGPAIQNNPDALMQYGSCQLSSGKASEAAVTFRQVTTLRPNEPAARYKLALALGSTGKTGAALELLKTLAPNSKVLNLSAEYYERQNDPASAVAALRKAIALAPAEEQNYVDLGQLYIERREPQAAVEVADKGLGQLPRSARIYTIRGAAYTWLNDPDHAARDFDRAEQLEPDQLYGAIGLSMLLRQDQQLPDAIRILRAKLTERPNDATLNYLLADTLLRAGAGPGQPSFAEAISLFKKSLQLQPGFQKARIALGKTYLRDSQPREAEEQFREAVRQDPHNRAALTQLVLLLRRNGKTTEAEAWAGKLKELVVAEK